METKEAKALYNTAPGIRFEKGKPWCGKGFPLAWVCRHRS
ncbi:hypothetical protein AB434_3074 [Heyndrickxia coagulans]|uniref:Uncharacterized protein n=1 Tax=Heyndrickxia coagulans TaxID=1398 RepID=A0AAN0T6F1_HEYCO|nr:hypothetical protein SB48_HM08orf03508 [Heyndrickxia coagulans]AKN55479.1 hypothetical protein AB434_3074 [Heyndrickxia coagulans]KYC59975.1 hypothetical protein B4100_3421 [Heyndrickxia coagulans]KYC79173.1 hypothetical protein B4096_3240 [Heyndrickxia coagulans]